MCLQYILSCWWFNQPIWKNMLLKLDHVPNKIGIFELPPPRSSSWFVYFVCCPKPPTVSPTNPPRSLNWHIEFVSRIFNVQGAISWPSWSCPVVSGASPQMPTDEDGDGAEAPVRFFEGEGWRFFFKLFSCFFHDFSLFFMVRFFPHLIIR